MRQRLAPSPRPLGGAPLALVVRVDDRLHAAWLAAGNGEAADAPPARRRALAREADVPYNRLINRNYESTLFWQQELCGDPAVAVLRGAGHR